MDEEEITQWLAKRNRKKQLSIEFAKELAGQSRLGWFIARYGHNRYAIGKVTLQKLSSRYFVTDDKGKALTFENIEQAKTFLKDELKILTPHVFG